MSKPKKKVIEYRSYDLPMAFPVLLLAGEKWHISDVPSDKLHFHNCLEIGVCHTDDGFMEFDGTKHPFRAGDMTFISHNVPHTTYSTRGKASLWSYLMLDPDALLRGGYFGDASPHAGLYREMLDNARMILRREEYPQLWELLSQIMAEMEEQPVNYQFSVGGLALSLMMKVMRIYKERRTAVYAQSGRGAEGRSVAQNALVIAPALDYIRDNYMSSFPMEQLADLCHLSPTHFRRVFHEIMQTSPLDYLNTTRVLQSCVFLRVTEDSILSVSERVGFRSVSSFNRHFYAVMGVRPSDWRKSITPAERASILQYSGWMQAQVPG